MDKRDEPTFFRTMVERLRPRYNVTVGYVDGKQLVRLYRPGYWYEPLTEAIAETREQALLAALVNRLVGEQD